MTDQAATLMPRIAAIAMAVLVHAAMAYAALAGFAFRVAAPVSKPLMTFDVADPAPPAPEPPVRAPTPRAETNVTVTPMPARASAAAAAPVAVFGKTPAVRAGDLARAAVLLRGRFHNERDYPEAARRRDHEGTVHVRYTIRADGSVSRCEVVSSSGSAALDETTCRIIRNRFRFSPALDRHGNPTSELRDQSVTWRLL